MSSFFILGFFALADGHVETTPKSQTIIRHHCLYNTTIQCSSDRPLPTELRVWCSSSNYSVLPNNTVAFIIAKAVIDTKSLLEAWLVSPMPGHPDDDDYDDHLPNILYPFVMGVGHVVMSSADPTQEPDVGITRHVNVQVSDYVRDVQQTSTIQYVFYHLSYFLLFDLSNVDVFSSRTQEDGETPVFHHFVVVFIFLESVILERMMVTYVFPSSPFLSISDLTRPCKFMVIMINRRRGRKESFLLMHLLSKNIVCLLTV